MEKVGAKIEHYRKKAGLSVSDLAGRLSVPPAFIHRLEAGKTAVTTSLLNAVASILGTSSSILLEGAELSVAEVPSSPVDARQSVFISYGGPDEGFARALNEHLLTLGVKTFFFPENASPGQRLHRTMSEGVRHHDRVILICSEQSLSRTGVLNELEQALQREAQEGGSEIIIPITLDQYVFSAWAPQRPDIADQIRGRVIADFRGLEVGSPRFLDQIDRLLAVLKPKSTPTSGT